MQQIKIAVLITMTESPLPDVCVIIPVFNDFERLRQCLSAINDQSYAGVIDVIVADNGSDEIPGDIEAIFPRTSIVVQSKPGSYAARNEALGRANHEVIAFTDSDCIPDADWIAQAVGLLHESDADLIAGHVDVFLSHEGTPTWVELYELALAFPQKTNATVGRSVTANLVIRAQTVLEAVPRFDEDTFSGADYAFTTAATAAGLRMIYGEDATVKHPARSSLAQLKRKIKRVVQGFYALRNSDANMAAEFTLKRVLSELAPPFGAYRAMNSGAVDGGFSTSQTLKVLVFAWYIKLYRIYLKAQLLSGAQVPVQR